MALPLSTPGRCCGHNLNMHSGNGLEGTCIVCSCVGFEPGIESVEIKMTRDRQCRAFHGQWVNLRCQEMIPEGAYHEDHWAIAKDGQTVRWTELVAMYPLVNPERVLVGESGPEVVGKGSAREDQVGGEHYKKYKVQPWDIIDEYDLDFYAGNALKYLLRHKADRLEDLKKARHYLDKLIELEEGGRGES